MRLRRVGVAAALTVLLSGLLSGAGDPVGPEPVPPANTFPPAVTGEPVYDEPLRAVRGTWSPESGLTFTYHWLRDGDRVRGATGRRYRPTLRDLGSTLAVRVRATDAEGVTGEATSEPVGPVRRADIDRLERPRMTGTPRYTRVMTADPGEWRPRDHSLRYRWLRDGEPIRGATDRRYRLSVDDVGHRVRVRVTVRAEGHRAARATSRPRTVLHRVPVRRTVTYRIETRGELTADLGVFRRQVAETFADPRGWRSAGVRFVRVVRGGGFSVVLARASTLPSFSSLCSTQWSCRVGRHVVINETRWRFASPSWSSARRSLRDYRHMVVNHETGHWLGHGHLGCPARGRKAPVMMQQSKGLDGCVHNPWPLPSELWTR